MKEITLINNSFAYGGFTSGNEGIWTRNEPCDPPTSDYLSLSGRLGIPLTNIVRPYQAGGDKTEIVCAEHGGSGVIKDNELKKVDGLITAEKGLVLSIIAADCVPVYLADESAGVIGLLHCGWRSAAGFIVHNAVAKMQWLGASPDKIHVIIGPHICSGCYEVGEEVRRSFADNFTENELETLFAYREKSLYLDLSRTIRLKAMKEHIPVENISVSQECTFHDTDFYSYRRGDRGRQNLAFIMMK